MDTDDAQETGRIRVLADEILEALFFYIDARDIFKFVLQGCKSLNARIFTHVKQLRVDWNPAKRDYWHGHFIRSFSRLHTFTIGDPSSCDGPYFPGIDIRDLPKSLTRLELHIANGFLSLLTTASTDPQEFCKTAKPLDLARMFPNLQHLHFKNNYSFNQKLPNVDLPSVLASLPLRTLTISPIRLHDLYRLPRTLTEITAIPNRADSYDGDPPRVNPNEVWAPEHPDSDKADATLNASSSEHLPAKRQLPPNLTKLELLQLNQRWSSNILKFPRSLKHLRVEFDDITCMQLTEYTFNMKLLPPNLESFNLRCISARIVADDFMHLPHSLTDFRICVLRTLPRNNESMWSLLPRQLKVAHLFTLMISEVNTVSTIPPSLVDLGTSEHSLRYRDQTTNVIPPTLARITYRPPRFDLPSSVLNRSSFELESQQPPLNPLEASRPIFREQPLLEMSHLVSDPLPYADLLTECSSWTMTGTSPSEDRPSSALISLLQTLPLKHFRGTGQALLSTLHQLWSPPNTPEMPSSSATQESGFPGANDIVSRRSCLLEEIELYNTRDTSITPDMSFLKDENRFPNLTKLCFASAWNTHLLACLPSTLTHLDIVSEPIVRYAYFNEADQDPLKWHALDLFPLLPRSLRYARLYACMMQSGNVFALLPPKLETLIIHGMEMANEFLPKKVRPHVPVDQLFHLPPSITRLTLPSFGNPSGLLITSIEELKLLQQFFSLRPQLIQFQMWLDYRLEGFVNEEERPIIHPMLLYSGVRFWSSTELRHDNTCSYWYSPLMPSRSLEIAAREICERRPSNNRNPTAPFAQNPSYSSMDLSPRKFKPVKDIIRPIIAVPYNLAEFAVLREPYFPVRDAAQLAPAALNYAIAYKEFKEARARKHSKKMNTDFETYEMRLKQ